jgi:hypothetical protein
VLNLIALAWQTGNLHLNLYEFLDLNVLGPAAQILRALSATTDTTTTALAPVPDAYIYLQWMGIDSHAKIAEGSKLADSGRDASGALSQLAILSEVAASYVSKAAGYQHRADGWTLQHNLAARELMQIGRQILTSLIAEQVTRHEYQCM